MLRISQYIILLSVTTLALTYTIAATAKTHVYSEKVYQEQWCDAHRGTTEFYLIQDRTRVDCLTNDYAVEVGFVEHKYEDVGQALYYSSVTGKKPAIVTIVENSNSSISKHLSVLRKLCNKYNITLFIMKPEDIKGE